VDDEDGRIADARRDVIALVRAYNADPRPGALDGDEIAAILSGASPRDVIAALLELSYEMIAALAEGMNVSEQDRQASVDRVLAVIQAEQLAEEAQG